MVNQAEEAVFEVPYRLLVGALIYRDREMLGVSQRELAKLITAEVAGFSITNTVLARIEWGSGACALEHLQAICTALRHYGMQVAMNGRLSQYADRLAPGALLQEADRHVVALEKAGISIVPMWDQLTQKELTDLGRQLRHRLMLPLCDGPASWRFVVPSILYGAQKCGSRDTNDERGRLLERAVQHEAALQLETPFLDSGALHLIRARRDRVASGEAIEVSAAEVEERLHFLSTMSYDEVRPSGAFTSKRAFEFAKAGAQHALGMRDTPYPDGEEV